MKTFIHCIYMKKNILQIFRFPTRGGSNGFVVSNEKPSEYLKKFQGAVDPRQGTATPSSIFEFSSANRWGIWYLQEIIHYEL